MKKEESEEKKPKKKEKEKVPKTSAEKITKELEDKTIILVRENGILRIGSKKVLENIETWIYHQKDATGQYLLIDFDSTKVAPIAKGILNELDLFPELAEIRFNNILSYVLISLVIVCIGAVIAFSVSIDEIAGEVQKSKAFTQSGTVQQKINGNSTEEVFKAIEERRRINEINKTLTGASKIELE